MLHRHSGLCGKSKEANNYLPFGFRLALPHDRFWSGGAYDRTQQGDIPIDVLRNGGSDAPGAWTAAKPWRHVL